jgi:hypothetical protein
MATLVCYSPLMIFVFGCVKGAKFLISFLPEGPKFGCNFLINVVEKIAIGFMGLLFYVAIFSYALSRFFIVVESFISLRHVPIGVYATPAWIQTLPHL